MSIFSFLSWISAICLFCAEVTGNNTTYLSAATTDAKSADDGKFFSHSIVSLQDSARAPVITSSSRTSKPFSYLLSWKPNAILTDIKFFKIRYKKDSKTSWTYRTAPANSSQYLLSNLHSSSLYEVALVRVLLNDEISQLAMSSFRTGTAKKESTNSTFNPYIVSSPSPKDKSNKSKSALVPDAPSRPSIVTTPTSVSLTWRPLSNGGSPITGFKVQMRILGGKKKPWKVKRKLPADKKSCRITNLKRDKSYKFRVIAINAIGESSPSKSARKVPDFVPIPKRPLIREVELVNGSVLVHWTYENVDMNQLEGFIVRYNVPKKVKKKIYNPHATVYRIDNPTPNKSYTIKIQAFSSEETSRESDPVKFKVVRDHAIKKDVIIYLDSQELPWTPHADPTPGGPGVSLLPPNYNNEAKEKSNKKDFAYIIAGGSVLVVIIILLASCIIYHKQKKRNQKKRRAMGLAKESSNLCTKIFKSCYPDEVPSRPPSRTQPPSPPRCSCYSGTSSPLRTNGSCIQSHRTSMSHSVSRDLVPSSRMRGSPMYTVYYDYAPGRSPPPCLATPGIPLCWVRGEGDEFCHIVPHDGRPKIEETVPNETRNVRIGNIYTNANVTNGNSRNDYPKIDDTANGNAEEDSIRNDNNPQHVNSENDTTNNDRTVNDTTDSDASQSCNRTSLVRRSSSESLNDPEKNPEQVKLLDPKAEGSGDET